MKHFLFTIFLTIISSSLFAQNQGGVKFKSHDHDLEERTSLILLEESKVNANDLMTLSTDILFNKTRKHYFGYILRIIDSNHRNIDIVYNYNNPDNYNFSLIYDHDITPIQFNFKDQKKALNEWKKLRLEVNIPENKISLTIGDQSKTIVLSDIQRFTNLKYYFGANNNPYFKVHDVAPITIRNIELQLDNQKLEWPLNEKNGTIVNCKQGEIYNGVLTNGIWLNELQSKWEKVDKRAIDGSLFYFNEQYSYYYFMKNDTLFRKDMYQEHPVYVTSGNYPFLNHSKLRVVEKKNKDLIFYNFITNDFYRFGVEDSKMNKATIEFPYKKSTTQHISWINDKQTELLFFGGYGNYEYSDNFSEIDLNKLSFENLSFKGDKISPRYFAGSGRANNGHHFIFGGYGSKTGKQIAHPENYYDLYDFDENTHKTRKIATWETTDESFVVSRNIVVDTAKNQFLALTFDNHVRKNNLKLKLFDITTRKVKVIANDIPFEFFDTQTTIELKYDKEYQKLYSIVLNRKGKKTKVDIYALDVTGGNFMNFEEQTQVVTANDKGLSWIFYLIGTLLLSIVAFALYKYKTRKSIVAEKEQVTTIKVEPKVSEKKLPIVKDKIVVEVEEEKVAAESQEIKQLQEDIKATSVINFFGGFRIIDENGNDISNKFTPLIKQIFLLIILSQFHNGRGVTVDQMTEVFWSDMPLKKARNNRSVNIAKLKQLFKLIGNINLVKTGDFWNLKFDKTVTFPLFDLKELLEKEQSEENLKEITKILKNGKLLFGTEYPWMEEMMAQIINGIIEKLHNYLISDSITLTVKEKLKISDLILKYDALNEEAIHIKCQIYTLQGMHSMAKDTFEKFEQEYSLLYNEKFDLDYNEFLKSDLTSHEI
ncbi:hypothetical protein [Flammeovirga kamogawensis]|uniref:Galactose oxidase n=1 Tax=Flammeovirga kamogawensis TaxID=373891 RepID=A0ABX8H3L7_9BACT|nr:hypothetical protein [Flammeovirga kamogawensis]MBB6460444.1 DNA-binding SARP family transcriptional activator [Flammeovirga kamogawensis]QWG10249.1 hypothetical protein KM029_21440 [Flammeovirga kamogawensis]TRX64698.1 hypothetical protein EO216_19365 [Flammeovirga kamogawensis]